ncbi:MAG: PQQ-binding-like beta-propeller repeat protein [Actinobacteria bacterium]|nr:PQQ-binding-like beta-propeller repeat protein [Actinomycetota bacterium]
MSAKPSLQLTLRLGESPAAPDPQSVMVSTARIPGGILLSANPTTGEGSLLTAIDADGDTRWTRCFADGFKMFVAPSATATKALLLFYVPQLSVSEVVPDWRIIDLATGATVGSLAALFAEQGVDAEGIDGWMLAWSARSALFGPAQDSAIDIARDRLIRVDFADFTATPIAFPASVAGQQPFEVQFGFTDADDVAVMAYEHGIATPTMLYINGAWTDDPTEFGMPPIRVGESMEDNGVSWLTGISRSGSEVWRVTDLPLIFGEGFRHATSDGVTVMAGCITFVDFECEQTLAGVDTATGSVLWTRDDYGGVLAIADGLALITPITPTGGTSSRILIDISTGEIADPSQRWSPNGYYQGCCGDESHWVQLSGGVLVANVDNVIEVWYPADVAPPTRTVSIP